MENILVYEDIEVQFSVRKKILTAIRGVSLEVKRNKSLAIVGESGSGKSVLVKTLVGMLEANGKVSSGKILYNGEDISKYKTEKEWLNIRGKEISMIFQDPMTALNPLKTIGSQIMETIILHKKVSKEEAKAKTIELLEQVGISNAENRFNQYPFEFSGGMRQRVVIAVAIACEPKILICDEPTTALDVTIQAQILNLLIELKEKLNLTIIFITHDLGVVAKIADNVAVMYAGDIVETGTSEEIFFSPKHPYTWALLSSLPQLGTKGERLYSIKGTPPSLYKEIKGDAFAPRNPNALEIDFHKRAPYFEITKTHKARTWLLDPKAPKIEPPEAIKNLNKRIKNE